MDEKMRKVVVQEILNGKSPVDIVIEYGIPPDEVEKIYREIHREGWNIDVPEDMIALFMIASIITTLDIITTRIALSHSHVYEANPLMSFLMNLVGVEYALLLNVIISFAGIIALTLLPVRSMKGYSRYVPLIIYSALRLIAVISNYKVLLGL